MKIPLQLACRSACATGALILLLAVSPASSQESRRDFTQFGSHFEPAPPDPAIARALKEISADQVQQIIEKLVSFGNRNTLSSMNEDESKRGVTAAADWIESEFKRYSAACGGCLEVKRDMFTEQPMSRIPRPTTITNVYAILRGTDPAQRDRMNLVTGHYDSRDSDVLDTTGAAPGANDDASGVAVSLECARVLSRLKFPSTLVFVAVAGEEQGLNGSAHLAHFAKEEGWHLEGVFNDDIVGGNTTPGDQTQDKTAVRVFSEGIPATATPEETKRLENLGAESDSASRELAREVSDVARTYRADESGKPVMPVLEMRRDRYLRGGDHTSFNREGFAAVRFTEWREDFNHQHQNLRTENGTEYGDLLKFVDFQYVSNVARLNAAALATLASAPGEPRNVAILTGGLNNNSTLRWEAPEGAPAGTNYQVVWRETGAANWEYAKQTNETTLTLPVSKDNVIFGVQSVDAAGHRSPAVLPMPAR